MLKIIPLELNSITKIENILGFSLDKIEETAKTKDSFYSETSLVIKGKTRVLDVPGSNLKIIQENMAGYFGEKVVWPNYVQGGVKNRSIKTNAQKHSEKKFVLSLDIENFFPSITTKMVKNAFIKQGLNKKFSTLISKLSTYKNKIPQGAPSSTYIANVVFLETDKLINDFCIKHSLIYTRFVDDLTISSRTPLFPYKGTVIKYITRSGLTLSKGKTAIQSSTEKQVVTKLVVNNKIRPDRKYMSALKKDIRETWKGSEGIKSVALKNSISINKVKVNLWGRASYIRQFDKKIYRGIRALLVKSDFANLNK